MRDRAKVGQTPSSARDPPVALFALMVNSSAASPPYDATLVPK
jgi:hypothetical protein